jgi:lipid-binding SYLF domain-containing protein
LTGQATAAFTAADAAELDKDATAAVAKVGASGSLDTTNLQEPVVAYTFGEKGLMADLSLEGAVFKKLEVK